MSRDRRGQDTDQSHAFMTARLYIQVVLLKTVYSAGKEWQSNATGPEQRSLNRSFII